jgi:spore maturation protein CgeB
VSRAKRIFFISDTKDFTDKLLLADLRKRTKGFIRLGHDTQIFSYNDALLRAGLLSSRRWSGLLYKSRVDKLLAGRIKDYSPDIVYVGFAKSLDAETIETARQAAPDAFFIGVDMDIWPEMQKGRVAAASELDLVITTYDGKGLDAYKQAGVKCVFMPNLCDPDIEHRYKVSDEWKSDILFTGKIKHKHYPTEDVRFQIINRLAEMENCVLYGCCGQPFIGGIQYLYAISGARVGLSINAVSDIKLYHSDRLTQYLACGTCVLAKYVPDSELLFKDGIHLKYFNTAEEFFDLADWFLKHENERIKIADAGMEYIHTEFNCVKIAEYTLDLIETGTYKAPWVF